MHRKRRTPGHSFDYLGKKYGHLTHFSRHPCYTQKLYGLFTYYVAAKLRCSRTPFPMSSLQLYKWSITTTHMIGWVVKFKMYLFKIFVHMESKRERGPCVIGWIAIAFSFWLVRFAEPAFFPPVVSSGPPHRHQSTQLFLRLLLLLLLLVPSKYHKTIQASVSYFKLLDCWLIIQWGFKIWLMKQWSWYCIISASERYDE